VGLIVTEGTTVNHAAASGNPDLPGIYGEAALKSWKRVVDKVHASGGAIIP
jgi:2,4-dienoyl-CoA reductase-like NADH-dependent reductase (Old Yellow Enzyme family)